MTACIERYAESREAWRTAAEAIYRAGQALIDDGKRVRILAEEAEDSLTLRQLKFIHGPVLQQISEQVRVGGVLYTKEVWKEHLKDLFIPDAWDMVRVLLVDAKTGQLRASKRKVPRKRKKSIADLGVKRCSDFIDKVLAHAATEWGVVFRFELDERDAVRYRPASKARAQAKREEAVTA